MIFYENRLLLALYGYKKISSALNRTNYESMYGINCSQEKIRKRRLFKKVQAFCEEKVLRYLLGVFWYAGSKEQCWQAEKWRLYYLICIFLRWPPN